MEKTSQMILIFQIRGAEIQKESNFTMLKIYNTHKSMRRLDAWKDIKKQWASIAGVHYKTTGQLFFTNQLINKHIFFIFNVTPN